MFISFWLCPCLFGFRFGARNICKIHKAAEQLFPFRVMDFPLNSRSSFWYVAWDIRQTFWPWPRQTQTGEEMLSRPVFVFFSFLLLYFAGSHLCVQHPSCSALAFVARNATLGEITWTGHTPTFGNYVIMCPMVFSRLNVNLLTNDRKLWWTDAHCIYRTSLKWVPLTFFSKNITYYIH